MTQITKIACYIFPIIIILVYYFHISFQKLKILEKDRLQFLDAKIVTEIETKDQLKSASKKAQKIQANTQYQLLKIKVLIINIDFTFVSVL
jgi:hypothetical protein